MGLWLTLTLRKDSEMDYYTVCDCGIENFYDDDQVSNSGGEVYCMECGVPIPTENLDEAEF